MLEAAFVLDSTALGIDLGRVVHIFGAFMNNYNYEVLPVVDQ